MPSPQQFWKTQEEQLKHKLSEFEERAETPLIPGELDNWLSEVGSAFEELLPQLRLQTQHIHADEFAEIAEEDPELFARIEEMRAEDQSIMSLADQAAESLESLKARREQDATETDLKQDLDDFVSLSLGLVTRIRKQEVTVRTWLVEAFTRDRGEMD